MTTEMPRFKAEAVERDRIRSELQAAIVQAALEWHRPMPNGDQKSMKVLRAACVAFEQFEKTR